MPRHALVLTSLLFAAAGALAAPPPMDPALREDFLREAVEVQGVDARVAADWLDRAQYRQSIVDAMSRPAEAVKPWKDYRRHFLNEARIRDGRRFLETHREALAAVEAETGVPAEMVVAILGVETSYGRITGSYRVIDALYTLGFHYPTSGKPERVEYEQRRGKFFRKELAQALALARDNGFDLDTLQGSYAGAMGWGQFMPSSYRAYARDGDGDGRVDLFGSLPDVFASVANYFVAHGWQRGEPVVARAVLAADAELPDGSRPGASYSLAELGERGVRPAEAQGHALDANVIALEGDAGPEHWLGFPNFYVITRYNTSSMYAMAVHQLSREIAAGAAPAGAP